VVLDDSRRQVMAKSHRPCESTDLRKSLPRKDAAVFKQAIDNVGNDRATDGYYRRVWRQLRLEEHDRGRLDLVAQPQGFIAVLKQHAHFEISPRQSANFRSPRRPLSLTVTDDLTSTPTTRPCGSGALAAKSGPPPFAPRAGLPQILEHYSLWNLHLVGSAVCGSGALAAKKGLWTTIRGEDAAPTENGAPTQDRASTQSKRNMWVPSPCSGIKHD
jgi:hypothetical protein